MTAAERRTWTRTLLEIGEMYERVNGWMETLESNGADASETETRELVRELRRRIRLLYGDVEDWTGSPTEDQRAQQRFLLEALERLALRVPEPR